MAVGRLRCVVIDVDDLTVAERFWSNMTGLPVITSNYTGRFSYLGQPDPWHHEIILQLVAEPKQVARNRCHLDLSVDDIDRAIEQILQVGGAVKKEPSIYPRPGSFPGKPPVIDWAVMTDPFGNEFCLVSELTDDESKQVRQATNATTDQQWRAAAGRTNLRDSPRSTQATGQ
jgi:predicted enzyme related to lactoylglutathione lyase